MWRFTLVRCGHHRAPKCCQARSCDALRGELCGTGTLPKCCARSGGCSCSGAHTDRHGDVGLAAVGSSSARAGAETAATTAATTSAAMTARGTRPSFVAHVVLGGGGLIIHARQHAKLRSALASKRQVSGALVFDGAEALRAVVVAREHHRLRWQGSKPLERAEHCRGVGVRQVDAPESSHEESVAGHNSFHPHLSLAPSAAGTITPHRKARRAWSVARCVQRADAHRAAEPDHLAVYKPAHIPFQAALLGQRCCVLRVHTDRHTPRCQLRTGPAQPASQPESQRRHRISSRSGRQQTSCRRRKRSGNGLEVFEKQLTYLTCTLEHPPPAELASCVIVVVVCVDRRHDIHLEKLRRL
jgi:hypothetical protein